MKSSKLLRSGNAIKTLFTCSVSSHDTSRAGAHLELRGALMVCNSSVINSHVFDTRQRYQIYITTFNLTFKIFQGWYFECECPRCKDPSERGSMTSATRCLRCGDEGVVLPVNPLDDDPKAVWRCRFCGHTTTAQAIDQLVSYFLDKLAKPSVSGSVEALEDLLEKSARLLHPHHYAVNLVRIKMNAAYINLCHRLFGEGGEYVDEQAPAEVYMRRKELLDDIHQVIEAVDPGLSRRRGLSLFETATCHLQLGRLLYESERFPLPDFLELLENESRSLEEACRCLEDARDGSNDAAVHYRAQAAISEAQVMRRLLENKQK